MLICLILWHAFACLMTINVSDNLIILLMRLGTCLFAILLFAERKQTPRKQKNHRAMDDIRESIAELKYYKDNIFKPQKSKK
jgi:hypothetical protein